MNFHDPTSNICHPRSNKGLTLLELLITLTIMAFLGVIALEAFRLGSRSWERGEGRAEREQRIRVIYGTLAQELASLQPITALVDGKQVLAFQGKSDRILFYSGPDGHRAFPYSAMIRSLAYFVEPGKGLLVQEGYPLVEGEVFLEPRGEVKILDPKAVQIRFRYLVPPSPGEKDSPRWVEAWDPLQVPGEVPRGIGEASLIQHPTSGLPLAVEVTVTVREEREEQELSFLLPIHVGRRL